MTHLLFPGRHLLNTAFQAHYLRGILQMPLTQLSFLEGTPTPNLPPIDHIVFAVTSSNQAHSRYNPIPFYVRAIGVDRFARPLEMTFAVHYRIIGIPHYKPTPRFAEYVLKEIEEQTEGNLTLTPANCVVLCSTPAVIRLYQALGFAILPAELNHPAQPPTPIALLQAMVTVGQQWPTDSHLRHTLAPATYDLWQDFPDIPRRIVRLWRDPLLNDSGSLTKERNYTTYAYGMSHPAIINLKYDDIKNAIQPGKIVDEGCADAALLALVAQDFPDSDLIGIEITGEFMARCQERQRAGDFGGTFVYFHQRNIMHPVFEPGSIDTTICNSTVHELWSYGEGAASVHTYFTLKYKQTARHGRLIIRDVVGPPNKEELIYMWLNQKDGRNEDVFQTFEQATDLAAYLQGVSTYGRFLRFARDFRGEGVAYQEKEIAGEMYIHLPKQDAAEFISKKDYIDNWASEMQEAFAFWDFEQWKTALQQTGFHILENPNTPAKSSRTYTNPWIVENRYNSKVTLWQIVEGTLQPLPYPPTNIILIGQKM